jgi:hypothetical protein
VLKASRPPSRMSITWPDIAGESIEPVSTI